jgi:ATPase subunit of ABC transporter with duplicated ATPase domains
LLLIKKVALTSLFQRQLLRSLLLRSKRQGLLVQLLSLGQLARCSLSQRAVAGDDFLLLTRNDRR